MKQLTVGSLFSGIGGIDLGLERAGMRTAWFSEIDPYASRVLAKHWPGVPNHGDVTAIDFRRVERPNVLAGGFPCQDISNAGKRGGIDGERSGLWEHFPRAIRALRPEYVLLENVAALLVRGLDRVLGDLAALGYDAEWEVLGADDLGATQHRKRVWILAYPHDPRLQGTIWAGKPHPPRTRWTAAHSEPLRSACGYWPPGPREVVHIPRMADGPANRMERLRSIGNGVVPDIPELIGGWIVEDAARAWRDYAGEIPQERVCAWCMGEYGTRAQDDVGRPLTDQEVSAGFFASHAECRPKMDELFAGLASRGTFVTVTSEGT